LPEIRKIGEKISSILAMLPAFDKIEEIFSLMAGSG